MKVTKDFLEDLRAYLWKRSFVVVRNPSTIPKECFCVVKDKAETTLIVDEKNMPEKYEKKEPGYRIITFDASLPFELVGFTAKISKALASEGVSILSVSSYSTDHFLIKDKDLSKAKRALKGIGVKLEELR
jgi:hypothetical protein